MTRSSGVILEPTLLSRAGCSTPKPVTDSRELFRNEVTSEVWKVIPIVNIENLVGVAKLPNHIWPMNME